MAVAFYENRAVLSSQASPHTCVVSRLTYSNRNPLSYVGDTHERKSYAAGGSQLKATMAGEHHHIIQKLLLRGFASKVDGKNAFAWQFRKNSEPKEINIRHLSVSKNFYGKQGSISADDEITDLEAREITPLIQSLRSQGASMQLHDERIPPFVAHLMVRTHALRQNLIENSDYLIECLRAHLLNPQALDEMLPGLSSLADQLLPLFEMYFSTMKGQNAEKARQAQIAALKKNVSPPLRVEALGELNWFLQILPRPHLIIGDVVTLSKVSGSTTLKSLPDASDVVEHVFVPIASDRVLVGSKVGLHTTPTVEDLNSDFASHSVDEFFASQKTEKEVSLQGQIGTKSGLLSRSMLDALVTSAIVEAREGPL
jgi:hypothetical protein